MRTIRRRSRRRKNTVAADWYAAAGNLAQFRPQRGSLSGLDGDTMLILAMMVMLYKDGGWDGCDKKLLMALAYLLT